MQASYHYFRYLAEVSMSQTPAYRDPHQPTERRVEDLLRRMTLPEKVGQLMQLNGQIAPVRNVAEIQPGSLLHVLNEELALAMDAAA
jgi:beta-glucosidase